MRLRITLPDDWNVAPFGRAQRATSPDGAITIDWCSLVPATLSDEHACRELLGAGEHQDGLRTEPTIMHFSEHGWPITEIVADAAGTDSRPAEHRRALAYRLLEWRGLVLVRAATPAAWAAYATTVGLALLAATPDWRGDGEVVCLADLFEAP